MYDIRLTKQAKKDAILIERAGMKKKVANLIEVMRENPLKNPPPYEALSGDRYGSYSRRINKQHRFVYEVLPNTENIKDENGKLFDGIIKVIRMWTHYE